MSSTRGRTASERAMHSRCCWPPDSAEPGCLSRSRTSFHSPARVRDSSTSASRSALRDLGAGELAARPARCRRSTSPGTGWASGRPCRSPCGRRSAGAPGRRCPAPSSRTSPASAAPGTSSCIRLRMRRNVDLPQPDGPISAVTCPAGMSRLTRSSTLRLPNQADTRSASRLAAVDGRHRRDRGGVVHRRRCGDHRQHLGHLHSSAPCCPSSSCRTVARAPAWCRRRTAGTTLSRCGVTSP